MDNEKTIGEKIYELRRKSEVSQETLSEHLGVTRQSVSRWESGSNIPETAKIIEIAKYFNVPASYLLDFEPQTESHSSQETKAMISELSENIGKTINSGNKKLIKVLAIAMSLLIVALSVVSVVLSSKISTLQDDVYYLENSYQMTQSQINSLQNQINSGNNQEEKFESELFNVVNCSYGKYDIPNGELEIDFDISLREYTEGMKLEVSIDSGDEITKSELPLANGIVRDCSVKVPISDNYNITATLTQDGLMKNEIFPSLQGALSASRVEIETYITNGECSSWSLSYSKEQGMRHDLDVTFYIQEKMVDYEILLPESFDVKVYINNEFVKKARVLTVEEYRKEFDAKSDFFSDSKPGSYGYGIICDDLLLKVGDKINVCFQVTDTFGETYQIPFNQYKVFESYSSPESGEGIRIEIYKTDTYGE